MLAILPQAQRFVNFSVMKCACVHQFTLIEPPVFLPFTMKLAVEPPLTSRSRSARQSGLFQDECFALSLSFADCDAPADSPRASGPLPGCAEEYVYNLL
mmetsp:Transcript_5913/g.11565  ORF Transcript_5913/g.11565 Transcript_5913/m.11565 type:complete len:99 (+) Transcript_5913:1294-1590(+)